MAKIDDYPTKAAYKLALSEHGRKAGRLGGPARAKALSKKRRREIASGAAKARWGKRG